MKKRIIKFRTYQNQNMIYQGSPDLETLQSFIFHWGDKNLMQFTGLKDCVGKPIYEGDILNIDKTQYPDADDNFKEVYFDFGMFRVKGERGISFNLDDTLEHLPYKIVGNIFENSDLLS